MKSAARVLALLLTLTVVAHTPSKDCAELKKEIADNLDAKGVKDYTLDIVATADVKTTDKVVGSCEGGTKKIVYTRK